MSSSGTLLDFWILFDMSSMSARILMNNMHLCYMYFILYSREGLRGFFSDSGMEVPRVTIIAFAGK